MSWPRGSLLVALLVLSVPLASADTITVNTPADDNAVNSLCSLREAVEYFNRGKPVGGYQGCVAPSVDALATVTLPANANPYVINGPAITIRGSLALNGAGRKDDTVTTVQAVGSHRAFVINQSPVYLKPPCADPLSSPCSARATDATALDLDSASDDGVAGDYLTTIHAPTVFAASPLPTTPAHSFVFRLYDNPKDADPVQIGSIQVDSTAVSGNWMIKSTRTLSDGVHFLTYTKEEIITATGDEVVPSVAHGNTLTVAIYKAPDRAQVTFSQMIIKGCAVSCADDVDDNTSIINDPNAAGYDAYALSYTNGLLGTVGNGGVIYSNEKLLLSDVLLQGGAALKGGGVYLAADGGAQITDTEIRENTADQGAAVYAERNSLVIEKSLLTENAASGVEAVVEVADSTAVAGLPVSKILNSTISANDGTAMSLRENMTVNASTVVLNDAGIDFSNEAVKVYNTILVGNTGSDCLQVTPALAIVQTSLVLTAGTCTSTSGTNNQSISNGNGGVQQLMATLDASGKCNSEFGLLCPLADNGGAVFTHLPRLLIAYSQISDSPIINKASLKVGTLDADACPGQDQRSENRLALACDIGAVEMQQVGPDQQINSGGEIVFGQVYTQSLGDGLADEELLPVSKCPVSPPADPQKVVAGSYRNDVPGCPWLEVAPGRGSVVFNLDGSYTYRPTSNFHGFDRFDFRVMTTLSRLNSLQADQSRLVRAQVIVEPSGGISSSSAGASDGWALLLLGLLGLRLRRREV